MAPSLAIATERPTNPRAATWPAMYASIAATSNAAGRGGEVDRMTDGTADGAGDGASMLCALQPIQAAKSRERTWSLTASRMPARNRTYLLAEDAGPTLRFVERFLPMVP
jgi:hypothetical protein